MSKVKEQMMQEKESEFVQELSYQEWLIELYDELSEEELNEMEQDYFKQSYFDKSRIITKTALNNPNYNPTYKTGA